MAKLDTEEGRCKGDAASVAGGVVQGAHAPGQPGDGRRRRGRPQSGHFFAPALSIGLHLPGSSPSAWHCAPPAQHSNTATPAVSIDRRCLPGRTCRLLCRRSVTLDGPLLLFSALTFIRSQSATVNYCVFRPSLHPWLRREPSWSWRVPWGSVYRNRPLPLVPA